MSLHYVALGDSTTVGVGDPMKGSSTTDLSGAGARPGEGWRGWASLLADALASSHRGHRRLARGFADELARRGLRIDVPPELDCASTPPSRWADTVWLVREGVPWLGRRAGDLTPWAARMAVSQLRPATDAGVQRVEA